MPKKPNHGLPGVLQGASIFFILVFSALGGGANAQDAPPPGVLVETLSPLAVSEANSFPGRVVASDKVDIVAQVSGIVTSIEFREGFPVSKGDVLYRLDVSEFQAAVDSANAAVDAAKAAARLLEIEWNRKNQLFEKGTITESELQLATAQFDQSKANVRAAEAALDSAKIQLGRTTIRAPLHGRMSIGRVSVGALVGPSSGALATLVTSDPIKVGFLAPLANYTEYLLDGRKLSDLKLSLVLPDGTIYEHTAGVDFAAPRAETTTNSIVIRAEVPNPDYILVDQQSVEVMVAESNPVARLTVPITAFLQDQIGTYVLVVGKDNLVKLVRPKLGREFGQRMEILGELEEGARVIVAGHAKARVGLAVSPEEVNPQPTGN